MPAAGCVSAYKLWRSWLHTTRIPALNIRVDYRGDIGIRVGNPQSFRKDRLEGQVFSAHWLACSLSHLFLSLNSPSSLNLPLCDRRSNPLPIFEVSCRTPVSPSCTKDPDSRCVPLVPSRREGCPPSACQQHASSSRLGWAWFVVNLLCCKGTLLAHVQHGVCQHPQVSSCKAAVLLVSPQAVMGHVLLCSSSKGASSFDELQGMPAGPFLQFVEDSPEYQDTHMINLPPLFTLYWAVLWLLFSCGQTGQFLKCLL